MNGERATLASIPYFDALERRALYHHRRQQTARRLVTSRVSVSDEIVRQEVSGLYRFIEPLVRRCAELREDYPVYDGTSLEFSAILKNWGGITAISRATARRDFKEPRPATSSTKRQKLLSLRSAWEDLHQYLRPALDADALHLPIPLIAALHDRLHETKDWRSYRFTLFHTDEANYFQLPSNMVAQALRALAARPAYLAVAPSILPRPSQASRP